jgi:hypothetical protein
LFNDSRKAGEWNPQFSHYSQHHEQWEGFVFGVIVSSLADWVPVRNDSECLTLMREDHYGHERSWQIKNLEFIGGFACLGDIRRLYQTGKSKAA